ncbi:hypothetical protein BG004_006915, partial [Podila humilis]
MSLPRFLRGFQKTKTSSSSSATFSHPFASKSDLNLSDASSSTSTSSDPKDALGQPLPVSTVIIPSSAELAPTAHSDGSLDLATTPLTTADSTSVSTVASVETVATTSVPSPLHDPAPSPHHSSLSPSRHNSHASTCSRASTTAATIPNAIAIDTMQPQPELARSIEDNVDNVDEDINSQHSHCIPHSPEISSTAIISSSCPSITTPMPLSIPVPQPATLIPAVHVSSPRPPRPSYPLPPIPTAAESISTTTDPLALLSSSVSSCSTSTSLPTSRNRVRSNALSVLSDSSSIPAPPHLTGAEPETFSQPLNVRPTLGFKVNRTNKETPQAKDNAKIGEKQSLAVAAPRPRSHSASHFAEATTTATSHSAKPVSILKKPRSILRSRSGSQPAPDASLLAMRTMSSQESLIPAFPAPPTSTPLPSAAAAAAAASTRHQQNQQKRGSGASDTASVVSSVSTSARTSWYLQHDPMAMGEFDRRGETVVVASDVAPNSGVAQSDAVAVVPTTPRVRRSSSSSHSQRRLSGRDQDDKEQDIAKFNSNSNSISNNLHYNTNNADTIAVASGPTIPTSPSHRSSRMPPATSLLASPMGPSQEDHDPVATKRRDTAQLDPATSSHNRLSFPSLNEFKSPPNSLISSLDDTAATETAAATSSFSVETTATTTSSSSPHPSTQPQIYTPLSLKTLRAAKSRSKLRQEPQIGVATGMRRNSLPKSVTTTADLSSGQLPPLPSVSPPPPQPQPHVSSSSNNSTLPEGFAFPSSSIRRNTEGAILQSAPLSLESLRDSLQQPQPQYPEHHHHQQPRRRENSYTSTSGTGGGSHSMPPVMLRPILKDTSAKDRALRESWMSEPPGNNASSSPMTPPKSLARGNSAKRQSKLSRMSSHEHDHDALTPRQRQPHVAGYGPDYRPRRQSGGPGHLMYTLDPAVGLMGHESEDNDDSDMDETLSRSRHLQEQYARLQKSQQRQSNMENPIMPHHNQLQRNGSHLSDTTQLGNNTNIPYDKPRQRKSLGDELNTPPVPEKSAQRKRVSTMGSATLPLVPTSLSATLLASGGHSPSISETETATAILRSDSKKQKDRKPFGTVGSNALSFEPLFVLKDSNSPKIGKENVLTTYRDSLASRLSGVSDADWSMNPLLTEALNPGVSIIDLSKKELFEVPLGLPT